MAQHKILMVTMGMDIGGAETHILELSKELARRGNEITVASNGGVYVQELEDAGIHHVSLPLHRRDVFRMVKSYFGLKRLIKNGHFDVVHAHARLPGFLCGLVRKTVKFPFVTSAHWVFDSEGLAGKLTNWGQKTIAVSDDIKAYLIESYGIPEQDIYVTINGIDMNRFSPEISGIPIRTEFGIPEDATVIAHVSRLDKGRAMVAGQLIGIAEALSEKVPALHLLIAGAGDQFKALSDEAEAVNERLGRPMIHMAGSRTDVNEVIAAGDLFVGVSRAALEAMSAAKPVLVAGDEGYIGTFEEEKFQSCWDTNFCCRGCGMSNESLLTRDLLQLLYIDKDKRQSLGDYGREIVGQYYSVGKMAEDTVAAYEAAPKRRKRVLISGYYGFKNAGDDAILYAIQKTLAHMDMPIDATVLSSYPQYTATRFNCRAVNRFNIPKLLSSIWHSDLLISGGGSLLQDRTSTRSLIYYLSVIRLAKMMRKRVILYANGIGPLQKKSNQRRVRRVVNKADIITLRESNSKEDLLNIGVTNQNIFVTADPVFLLEQSDQEKSRAYLKDIGLSCDRPIVGVSVRALNTDDAFIPKMAALCDEIHDRTGADILFIIMHHPNDIGISRAIQRLMHAPSYLMEYNYTPSEIMGITSCMAFVVSMRLHTMIFAAKEHVPVIGIDCDPKIRYYTELFQMPTLDKPADMELASAKEIVMDMAENRDQYVERIAAAADAMGKASEENEVRLREILNQCP